VEVAHAARDTRKEINLLHRRFEIRPRDLGALDARKRAK